MTTKSSFIKEFFLISNIYRTMSSYVKQQLKQHNIPVNEVQLNLLFLMYSNDGMSSEELLNSGNFALSTLLFNMNNLQNASLIDTNEDIVNTNLHKEINISKDGYSLLEKIDKLFQKDGDIELYTQLINYEKKIEKIVKN